MSTEVPLVNVSVSISSLEALSRLAKAFTACLKPGDVMALTGDLGAGKTTFTQCLAKTMGIKDTVNSPTFALIHEYHITESVARCLPENLKGLQALIHADVYRLGPEKAASLEPELSPWLCAGNALLMVEWANYAPFLASDVTFLLQFSLSPPSSSLPETRTLIVSGTGLDRLIPQLKKFS